MTKFHLHHALKALQEVSDSLIKDAQVEKVGEIIQSRAIVAAAGGIGTAILPGVGSVVAAAVAVGAVWEMYVQINRELRISISDNKLKSLASAMLSNLLSNIGGAFLAMVAVIAGGFIPIINTLLAPIQAMIGYISVFAAGILYVKFLTKVFKAKGSFSLDDIDENKASKDVIRESDVNSMVSELKKSFREDKDKIDAERRNRR